MVMAGNIVGFADFESSLPLPEVAKTLSKFVFGGIAFIEKDVDEDCDLGTLTLANIFLGLQVDLIGHEGKYSLELGSRPASSVASVDDTCNLSEMLRQQIEEIEGFSIAFNGF